MKNISNALLGGVPCRGSRPYTDIISYKVKESLDREPLRAALPFASSS